MGPVSLITLSTLVMLTLEKTMVVKLTSELTSELKFLNVGFVQKLVPVDALLCS